MKSSIKFRLNFTPNLRIELLIFNADIVNFFFFQRVLNSVQSMTSLVTPHIFFATCSIKRALNSLNSVNFIVIQCNKKFSLFSIFDPSPLVP